MTGFHRPVRRRVLAAIALFAAPFVARAQDPRGTLAHRAALEWLALVDRFDSAASYAAASGQFRATAPEAVWAKAIESDRRPLGAVVSRTLTHTEILDQLPNVEQKGEYALLVYRTAFTSREMTERMTLGRDADGVYRVVGYAIGG